MKTFAGVLLAITICLGQQPSQAEQDQVRAAGQKFGEASSAKTLADKVKAFTEAQNMLNRVLQSHPNSRLARLGYCGAILGKVQAEIMDAQQQSQAKPSDGRTPIQNATARTDIRVRYDRDLSDVVRVANDLLAADPNDRDAPRLIAQVHSYRALLAESASENATELAEAEVWQNKATVWTAARGRPGIPAQIRLGGGVMASKLIEAPKPVYPEQARIARIQGVVRFNATIGKEGTIQQLQLVSGHPLFVPSATEAVRQWRYQPTLLNGQAVEVVTQIDVNYTLSE